MKITVIKSFTRLVLGLGLAVATAGQAAVAPSAAAGPVNAPPATDAKSFQILVDNNIFDRNRPLPIAKPPPELAPSPDWFRLTGTMSYPGQSARQSYAFFDGSSRNFQQAFKPSDTIAGFKITEITSDHVTLTGPDNKVTKLYVQTQLRKPQGGSWSVLGSPDAPVEPVATMAAASDDGSARPTTTSQISTGSTADEETARKMTERRAEEP